MQSFRVLQTASTLARRSPFFRSTSSNIAGGSMGRAWADKEHAAEAQYFNKKDAEILAQLADKLKNHTQVCLCQHHFHSFIPSSLHSTHRIYHTCSHLKCLVPRRRKRSQLFSLNITLHLVMLSLMRYVRTCFDYNVRLFLDIVYSSIDIPLVMFCSTLCRSSASSLINISRNSKAFM